MNNKLSLLFLFFTALLGAKELEKVSLQLQWLDQFQFAGYYVAKEKGFYKEVGLAVDFKEDRFAHPVDTVVNAEATYGVTRSSIIIDKSRGKDLVLLASVFQSSPMVLLARKDSAIESVKDFAGKKIMVSANAEQSAPLIAMINKYGMDHHDFINIPHSYDLQDLIEGKTDLMACYISNEPFILREKGIEFKVFDPKEYGFSFYGDILFTSGDEIKNHKERAANFTEATMRGWEYAFEHIDETAELILQKYNTQNKSKAALIYEANSLKKLAYEHHGTLGEIDKHKLQRIYDFYNIMGFVEKKIDIDTFVMQNNAAKKIFWTDEEKAYLQKKKQITMCVEPSYYPIEELSKGEHSGIVADMIALMQTHLPVPFEVLQVKTKRDNIANIASGKCDIKSVVLKDFFPFENLQSSLPYIEDSFALITKIDKPYIRDLSYYADKTFAVPHISFKNYFNHKFPYLNVVVAENPEEALQWLANDKVYGYIDVSLIVNDTVQRHDFKTLKVNTKIENTIIEGAVGVLKSEPQLLGILNKIIQNLPPQEIEHIKAKWSMQSYRDVVDYTLVWQLVILFSIILLLGLYFSLRQYRLKQDLKELNRTLEEKVKQRTEEQNVLLSLFDIGESVLFKWKNDAQWSVVYASQSVTKLLGYDKEDFLSNKISYASCIHENDLSRVQIEVSEAIEQKMDYFTHEPYRLLTNRGEIKWVYDTTRILRDADGTVLNFIGYTIDITALKRRDQQFLQQTRLAQMGEMISMIAHQWRQPLAAIAITSINLKMQLELQKFDLSEAKGRQAYMAYLDDALKQIDTYVGNLSTTIDDFRNFYKSNKESKTLPIGEPIDKALDIIRASLISDDIEIIQNNHTCKSVEIYMNELMQVILSILQNAQDNFIEKSILDPVISITCKESGDGVSIEICDNGGGISEAIIPRIFDPYFSTKSEKNGTGLGLYMSKMIIEDHHKGTLTAHNRDSGVCFTITLNDKL